MTDLYLQKGKLEISYDTDNDVLWMSNEKQAPRGFDIVKNQVIVFFDYDGTTPTALMVFDAAELLGPFFGPPDAPVSKSCPVVYGDLDESVAEAAIEKFLDPSTRESDSLVVIHRNENGERIFEKFLKTDNLSISYESDGDMLSLGNGRPAPRGGHDIAEGLIVFFENEGVPVHIELFDAAELLTPIFAQATASEAARLV